MSKYTLNRVSGIGEIRKDCCCGTRESGISLNFKPTYHSNSSVPSTSLSNPSSTLPTPLLTTPTIVLPLTRL
jgi:hypothetical protein